MTSLMHFEEKVHRKGLVRAESLLLLMPRLLCQVLEHLGFPEEPRIERRIRCPLVLLMERVMTMPISFLLQQRDQEEVPAPEPEVERSPAPHMSPPSPHPHATSTAAADTPGPSYTSHHSPEYVHASSREIAGVMDAICSLVATQAAQDQRLAQCYSMLQHIMTHLGVQHVPDQREELQQRPHLWMFWKQQQLLQTHHHHSSEVVRFLLYFCIVTSFINCLLILIRIYVLALVGSDTFVFSFVFMY